MLNGNFRRGGKLLVVIFICLSFSTTVFSQKLTAEEIIEKHLQALGGKENLEKAKRRLAIGASEFISRLPSQRMKGTAVFASDGVDVAFLSKFDHPDYTQERIGIFSNKVTIPFLREGMRSPLGAYLLVNDRTVNDRIFGGSIFASWRLLNSSAANGKFEADGKKKIDGREAWVIRFRPKASLPSNSTIRLYFDAETFNHVRTVMDLVEPDKGFYEVNGPRTEVGPGMASNGSTLTEDFGDFKAANGLMLPHSYKIDLTLNGLAGTAQFKWNFKIVEYRVVNDFGKGFFSFTT